MALQKDTAVSTNERSERSSERNEEEYVSVLGYFRDLPIHHFLKSSKNTSAYGCPMKKGTIYCRICAKGCSSETTEQRKHSETR